MTKEIKALELNHTWELTTLPSNKSPIGCKWVFRVKYNAHGSIEIFKSILLAKGFTKKEGIDYKETFVPVAKMVTARALLATEVYMTIPQGYTQSTSPNTVCKLKKSLYGLKEANRQWFTKLTTFLTSLGFTQSYADTSLFIISKQNTFIILLVYVDDILLAEDNQSELNNIKQQLHHTLNIKDLSPLHYYLGIKFLRNPTGLTMSQRKDALERLQHGNVLNAKPAITPLDPQTPLNTE
ncbi:retrovirus-related pol polyprotein from transposon TNT 1-94 [Tanacetum coccineum]